MLGESTLGETVLGYHSPEGKECFKDILLFCMSIRFSESVFIKRNHATLKLYEITCVQ